MALGLPGWGQVQGGGGEHLGCYVTSRKKKSQVIQGSSRNG